MRLRVLLLAALVLALPASASAAARWVGFNDISPMAGVVSFDAAARAAAAAGATSTRAIVDWSWIEPVDDEFNWGPIDGLYRADLARGMRPLIGVTGAPRWAWDPSASCPAGTTCARPPGRAHYGDYEQFMRLLTRRYPRAVAIEVGNEPNLGWAWAGGVDPARYTRLLKHAYRAVKSVNPAMPVLSGGLAPDLSARRTAGAFGLRPFLRAMYRHGARGHMDGISIHPYPWETGLAKSFAALSQVEDVRDANRDAVPLWVTEVGLTTADASAADQAGTLTVLYDALRTDPEVRSVYVHTLYDDPGNPVREERGYGLLHADGTPKPAYCGLALANGAVSACAASLSQTLTGTTQVRRWEAQVLLQAAANAARRVRRTTGSYSTVGAAALHAVDSRISARPASGRTRPGLLADPERIGVFPIGRDGVVLCNASTADRSYCLGTARGRTWAYGSSGADLYVTAGETIKGHSVSW